MKGRISSVLSMLALSLVLAPAMRSSATSTAGVSLSEPFSGGQIASDYQYDTATPATATLNGVVGNARADIGAGLVGAGLELSAASPFGFYSAGAQWIDTWTGSLPTGNVPLAASITLRGSIDTSLLAFSDPFWEIRFDYVVGVDTVLSFGASGDSSIPEFFAFANGNDVSGDISVKQRPFNAAVTDFTLVTTPTVSVNSSGFSEVMTLEVRADAEGPLMLDMFHTVSVQLTSLDPGVTFTGEGGRTIASVPEPGTLALLAAGLGGVAWHRRRDDPGLAVGRSPR
jgi:hypothetical protein